MLGFVINLLTGIVFVGAPSYVNNIAFHSLLFIVRPAPLAVSTERHGAPSACSGLRRRAGVGKIVAATSLFLCRGDVLGRMSRLSAIRFKPLRCSRPSGLPGNAGFHGRPKGLHYFVQHA